MHIIDLVPMCVAQLVTAPMDIWTNKRQTQLTTSNLQSHATTPLVLQNVLQCVAACCSVLQCVAMCCSVLQYVAVCCSVLQCIAVCCCVSHCVLSVLQRQLTTSNMLSSTAVSSPPFDNPLGPGRTPLPGMLIPCLHAWPRPPTFPALPSPSNALVALFFCPLIPFLHPWPLPTPFLELPCKATALFFQPTFVLTSSK